MELWVRSQDKTRLIPNPNLYVVESEAGISYVGDTMVGHIGTYKTKERALEVLNKIHQRLINLQCLEILGGEYVTNQMKRNGMDCVYEMPLF